jgi:(p)ppGpp synthase/HD superfamily hydrolase
MNQPNADPRELVKYVPGSNIYNHALTISRQAHLGQKDKSGEDYVKHPIRVAEKCQSPNAKVVALLHDTIEDTGVSADYLRSEGFPEEIIDGVLSVTKRDGESYEDFVCRAAENPLGREVKIADLEDNMDIRRLKELTEDDVARLRKYLHAWQYLMKLDK